MKKVLFLIQILCMSFSLHAQVSKVTIYCTIDPVGRVDYNSLDKILPDSLRSKILVNPRKEFKIRDGYRVLLWMSMNDWKLVSAQSKNIGDVAFYTMSKEIWLDKQALEIFVEKIKIQE